MSKFTFICDSGNGDVVTYQCQKILLHEVVESFEYFLKGIGYHFTGNLDFFDENDEPSQPEDYMENTEEDAN